MNLPRDRAFIDLVDLLPAYPDFMQEDTISHVPYPQRKGWDKIRKEIKATYQYYNRFGDNHGYAWLFCSETSIVFIEKWHATPEKTRHTMYHLFQALDRDKSILELPEVE